MKSNTTDSMNRRRYLVTTAAVAMGAGLAGCTASSDDPAEEGEDPEPEHEDTTVEYDTPAVISAEDLPEGELDDLQTGDYVWMSFDFEVVDGELDVGDILEYTHVNASGPEQYVRGVTITSGDNETITSSDNEYTMVSGDTGRMYVRMFEDPQNEPVWGVEELQDHYDPAEFKVELRE